MQLSETQLLAFELLNDEQIVDLLFGGGAGGGKTGLVCIWALTEMRQYPGIRFGLGRKEMKRLKDTTLRTLLDKVHPIMGITKNDYDYKDQQGLVTYANGCEIQLVDLQYQPSDPEYDTFGGFEFTHVLIEEVAEIPKKGRDVFISRKNRWLNDQYGIVGKSVSTCNPSQNYIKSDYYEPYHLLGGGPAQKWDFGRVEINGEMKPAYRAFVRSLAADNPFISQNYIENLKRLPLAERLRLLEGDWNYEETDKMLFKPMVLDRSTIGELGNGRPYIGVDVADVGRDRTILSLVRDKILVDQKEIEIDPMRPVGEQIAFQIIKYAQQQGMTSANAQDIAYDVLGVGASTRDFLRQKGWFCREFVAGASTQGNFKNLRGEVIYLFSQALEGGIFKIYNRLPTLDLLRKQLMAFEYETEERTILVKSKKLIKEDLGESPDHAESAYIAFWVSNGPSDPKNDPSRVSF
jgi:hypothetical protein